MNEVMYSFIIPIYNGENYIDRCLNSIWVQNTEYSYEVIAVDDGSVDNSLDVLKKHSLSNENILILHQKNKGVSAARNTGIKKAKGKYVIFIDIDDTISEDFLKNIDEFAKLDNDVIKTRVNVISSKKYDGRFDLPCFNSKKGIDALKEVCINDKVFALAWSYVFKIELFKKNKIKFPVNKVHEDLATIPIVLYYANSVTSLDYTGYNYFKHKDSLSTKNDLTNEFDRLDDFLFHCYKLMKFFDKRDKNLVNYFYTRMTIKINNLIKNKGNINLEKLKNYKLILKMESLYKINN